MLCEPVQNSVPIVHTEYDTCKPGAVNHIVDVSVPVITLDCVQTKNSADHARLFDMRPRDQPGLTGTGRVNKITARLHYTLFFIDNTSPRPHLGLFLLDLQQPTTSMASVWQHLHLYFLFFTSRHDTLHACVQFEE